MTEQMTASELFKMAAIPDQRQEQHWSTKVRKLQSFIHVYKAAVRAPYVNASKTWSRSVQHLTQLHAFPALGYPF